MEEINEKDVNGKVLYCGRAQKRSERQAELRRRFQQQKMERINQFQGVNLYIKNLEETIDDTRLRKEFESYGTITSAKVMRDEKGNSKGMYLHLKHTLLGFIKIHQRLFYFTNISSQDLALFVSNLLRKPPKQ